MGMPAITQEWTVDMLDALPDDGQRHEIIDGVLFVTPGPGEMHQDVVGELYGLLRDYLMGSDIGKVMVSPSDVRRGDRRRNRVQPDVFVIQKIDGKRLERFLANTRNLSREEVELLRIAPFGDPVAISVSGYILSLRKDEAATIRLRHLSA